MPRTLSLFVLLSALGCGDSPKASASDGRPEAKRSSDSTASLPQTKNVPAPAAPAVAGGGATGDRTPNELGLIPVLEYHLVGDREWRWGRERSRFRKDLETLYARGYRPVT